MAKTQKTKAEAAAVAATDGAEIRVTATEGTENAERAAESSPAVDHVPDAGKMVAIELAIGKVDSRNYMSARVDLHLASGEARVMAGVLAWLQARTARLKSGRLLQNNGDVVRYILEQIAARS